MFIGPIFSRELVTAPRRPRLYLGRAVYVATLFVLMCTSWLVLTGTQVIGSVGQMARFGGLLFQILAPLQVVLFLFFSAFTAASAVAHEKDRRTLVLLLMTRLTNSELVLGRLFASLLSVLVMLVAAAPFFMLVTLFGGVGYAQVGRALAVTAGTVLAAGSLGALIAFWRESTFQTLAVTALLLVFWLGGWEVVYSGVLGHEWLGLSCQSWAAAFSPWRAIESAVQPFAPAEFGWLGSAGAYLLVCTAFTVVLAGVTVWRVRIWNPSRVLRRGQRQEEEAPATESIFSAQVAEQAAAEKAAAVSEVPGAGLAEAARSGHVDARVKPAQRAYGREVWNNPVLWREMCTWAYGRKVLVVRLGYLLLFVLTGLALHFTVTAAPAAGEAAGVVLPAAARPLAPFLLLSAVLVNALAVLSVTSERDVRSLDLLLATDLSPAEFLFGKLGGVFWITKEMVVLPVLLCLYMWWAGGIGGEDLAYLLGGMLVLYLFVAVMGLHCGMIYANGRTAIGVSLGTVFFLFLGVVTCILMMISFSGSFQVQYAPFLAFILGGGIGLYVALGARNPSGAILTAAVLVPLATFYAITSFLLAHNLAAFLVVVAAYGFTTAAMLVPALYEFDIAMGRTTTADE